MRRAEPTRVWTPSRYNRQAPHWVQSTLRGAGGGKLEQPLHQLRRLPILRRLEVRVGAKGRPATITMPSPTRDGAHVHTC